MATRKPPRKSKAPGKARRRPGPGKVGEAGEGARLEETARAVAAVLRKIGKPSAIIGGVAVIAHGHARSTSDVDCAIAASLSDSAQIYDTFLNAGFEPRYERVLEHAQESLVLTLRYARTGVNVDASFAHQEFEYRALTAAKNVKFGGSTIPVPSVTALAIYKMFAGRPQDITDVRRLLTLGHKIQRSEVERQLREFDELLDTDQAGEWRRLLASLV